MVTALHHPTIPWQPLVPTVRVARPSVKDKIKQLGSNRGAAADIQGELNLAARNGAEGRPHDPAAVFGGPTRFASIDRALVRPGVSADRGLVPSAGTISGLVKDTKRSGRHNNDYGAVTEWQSLDNLIRGAVRDYRVCVHYQVKRAPLL